RVQLLLVTVAPWMLVLTLLLWLNVSAARRAAEQVWNVGTTLRRPRRVRMAADTGMTVETEKMNVAYRWSNFRRAWETDHLIVLADENELRHILPKRAFDEASLGRTRALIASRVADSKLRDPPRRAFAIDAVAPPKEEPPK